MAQIPELDGRCVRCEVAEGLPTVNDKVRGYYVSRQDGRRMLVLERRNGDRIRINSATEVVIVEIRRDLVTLRVESLTDGATKS